MVMAIPELWLCTVLTNYNNYVCVGVCVGLVRLKLCIYNDKVLIKYITAYVYVLIASLYYELSDYIWLLCSLEKPLVLQKVKSFGCLRLSTITGLVD